MRSRQDEENRTESIEVELEQENHRNNKVRGWQDKDSSSELEVEENQRNNEGLRIIASRASSSGGSGDEATFKPQ